MVTSKAPLWLSWETHRRSTNLANRLEAELLAIDFTTRTRIVRYALSTAHTIGALITRRPSIVIAQNPSIALCALLSLLKPVFSYRYVIDAHNHALDVTEQLGLSGRLARWIFAVADLVIVTNPVAAERVKNATVAILPDPISAIAVPASSQRDLENFGLYAKQYLMLICSFDPDEPVETVIDAVMGMPEAQRPVMCISGKKSKASAELLARENESVVFLDYIPDHTYESLIAHAQLLIDLTDYEDGLVCGFSESLAVGVPILLSDNLVSKATFGNNALYTKNTVSSIRSNIESFISGKESNLPDAAERKSNFELRWKNWYQQCSALINGGTL